MTLTDAQSFDLLKLGLTILSLALVAIIGFLGNLSVKKYEFRSQQIKDEEEKRLQCYLPLFRFTHSLDRRLARILSARNLGGDWLSRSHLERIHAGEGFAKDIKETGYFVISTVYHIALIFGWAEAIKKIIDSTSPPKKKEWWKWGKTTSHQSRTYSFDKEISVISRIFQYEEMFKEFLSDKPVSGDYVDAARFHKLVQYSVGELMLEADDNGIYRCKSFREFTESYYSSDSFRYWFEPIVLLVADLSGFESDKTLEAQVLIKRDLRPLRLIALRYWCRVLMGDLSRQLKLGDSGIYKTLKPDEVLNNLSPELQKAIKAVEFGVEPYIGVSFNE